MKKFLIPSSVVALLLPGLALAAYNDTSFATGVVLSIGGVTVTVSGTNAVIESMSVSTSAISVSLLPNSFIEVQSTDRKVIATNAPAGYIVTDTCSATASTLKLSSSISTGSMTITPSSGTCSGNASGNSTTVVSTGSGAGSAGGGGGGGGYTPTTRAAAATTPATAAAPATAVVATPATPASSLGARLTAEFGLGGKGSNVEALQTFLETKGFLKMPAGVSKGTYGTLTRTAVMSYQKSKGISQTGYIGPQTRVAVNAELGASASAASPAAPATVVASENASFKRDLETGSKGSDVRALQAYLNSHGFSIAASGAGSPGNETELFGGLTRAALAKWQASVGITPAAGYFGPKTRAYIAANP
ncbi:MAG: peptidoglycan-binding protein [Patescibacteria group bacterium]